MASTGSMQVRMASAILSTELLREGQIRRQKRSKLQVWLIRRPRSQRTRAIATFARRVSWREMIRSMKTLADRAHMSEPTAARCKEAWNAVIAALIEIGRLPDPAASKKATSKVKPAPVTEPAATETTVATPPAADPPAKTATT